eukprot:PLAT15433.1.p2 GENE.PLAT15433.1~~PLAT15433.1.p2  ORF type:complete len:327 (-),score=165.06 PLAT15433.1:48-1028(-)
MQRFDLFLKPSEGASSRSLLGGVLTLLCALTVTGLVLSETASFLADERVEKLGIVSSHEEQLPVYFNITFPGMDCKLPQFDVVDASGMQLVGASSDIKKTPLGADGQPLPAGSRDAAKGCNFVGSVSLNKVAGNLHIALGHAHRNHRGREDIPYYLQTDPHKRGHYLPFRIGAQHPHQFSWNELKAYNSSHIIHSMSFGDNLPFEENPLKGKRKSVRSGLAQYNYYLELIPVEYVDKSGRVLKSHRFSVRERNIVVASTARSFPHPGVFFIYDVSYIAMTTVENSHLTLTGFGSWLTDIVSVVGGVFTVAGLLTRGLRTVVDDKRD